jgi:uncharacterized membrane protein
MNLEKIVSLTLRIGVILSSSIVLVGLFLFFVRGNPTLTSSAEFDVAGVLEGIARGNPSAIILLGIIVLVVTPALRVFELLLSYALERDRLYTLLSILVLFFMAFGIVFLPLIR